MNLPVFTTYLLILALLVPVPASAKQGLLVDMAMRNHCAEIFAQVKEIVTASKAKEAAAKAIEEVEAKKVEEIFSTKPYQHKGKWRFKVQDKEQAAYQAEFDKLWNAREKSGLAPKEIVRSYRRWLRAQNDGLNGAYPLLDPDDLYRNYMQEPRKNSMAAYFDDSFLDFLAEQKGVYRGSAQSYLESIDRRLTRRLADFTKKNFKAFASLTGTALLGAITLEVYKAINAGVNAATDAGSEALIGQTPEEAASDLAKKGVELISDWATVFPGGREAYDTTVVELSLEAQRLASIDFDKIPRPKAEGTLMEYMAFISERLPRFQNLAKLRITGFEDTMNKKLAELKPRLMKADSDYRNQKNALRAMEIEFAERRRRALEQEEIRQAEKRRLEEIMRAQGKLGPNESLPESESDIVHEPIETQLEAEQRAELEQAMAKNEAVMAVVLAEWMVYKQARGGEKNPMDPILDEDYQASYDYYMDNMSPGLLAKTMNARVSQHILELRRESDYEDELSKSATNKRGPR